MRPPASRPPPEGPAPLGAASELDGAPAVSRREFAGWTALWLWAAVWQSQSTRSVCVPEVFWSFCENKTRPQNLFQFLTPRGLMRNQSESFFLRNRTQKLLRMTGLRQAPSSAERARRTQHAFVFQNRLGPPPPVPLAAPACSREALGTPRPGHRSPTHSPAQPESHCGVVAWSLPLQPFQRRCDQSTPKLRVGDIRAATFQCARGAWSSDVRTSRFPPPGSPAARPRSSHAERRGPRGRLRKLLPGDSRKTSLTVHRAHGRGWRVRVRCPRKSPRTATRGAEWVPFRSRLI